MVPELSKLTEPELELMYKAPLLVSVLIAGADGTIDRKEIAGAIRSVQKKQQFSVSSVAEFFKEISNDFEDKLKMIIQGYPYESTQRTPLLVADLAELNPVLAKIDPPFAAEFYQTLLVLADKIARSSGGLFGLRKVGEAEALYMQLPMLRKPGTS
jgi:hypothetical protein